MSEKSFDFITAALFDAEYCNLLVVNTSCMGPHQSGAKLVSFITMILEIVTISYVPDDNS